MGDTGNAVDIRVQNPSDHNTFFIDGNTGNIGIGTSTPEGKLHVTDSLLIPAGDNASRLDKTGSIRWNNELQRYEGYDDTRDTWLTFTNNGDDDGDTYITYDAGDYVDSDRVAIYTAGCSAMTIHPNQTVVFAGDVQFDNIKVRSQHDHQSPATPSEDFIYIKINGRTRAIRLWDPPTYGVTVDLETIHGESVSMIDEACAHGEAGQGAMETIDSDKSEWQNNGQEWQDMDVYWGTLNTIPSVSHWNNTLPNWEDMTPNWEDVG